MLKKLSWNEITELKANLEEEKYFNLFFINNIESLKNGIDYVVYGDGNVFIMHHKEFNVLVYAKADYDGEQVYEFLNTLKFHAINSAEKYLKPLLPYLEKDFKGNTTELMYVDRNTFKKVSPRSNNLRLLLAPEDFEKLGHLYQTSEDFGERLKTEEDVEDWAWEMAEKEYPFAASGYFVKKRLVAGAYLSAYTKKSAMVVGVYVHPDFENVGIGTALVSELTDLALNENLIEYLCLFYSTPKAKHVYEKLGYETKGKYTLMKRKN